MSVAGKLGQWGLQLDGQHMEFDAGGNLLVQGAVVRKTSPAVKTTAGNVTFTADEFLGGLILRDPNGAARTDKTPDAADIVKAVGRAVAGFTFLVAIRNTADAAEAITLSAGAGVTISGSAVIGQGNTGLFLVRIDSASAVTIYTLVIGAH